MAVLALARGAAQACLVIALKSCDAKLDLARSVKKLAHGFNFLISDYLSVSAGSIVNKTNNNEAMTDFDTQSLVYCSAMIDMQITAYLVSSALSPDVNL